MNPIERYFDLVDRIDQKIIQLSALHGKHIFCAPGCCHCCVNLSVFPVEFAAIRQRLTQAGLRPVDLVFDESAPCGFLSAGLCRIYDHRPIICRTHGLPILYIEDTEEEAAFLVSFCELNFTGAEDPEFTEEALLDIEAINTDLCRINKDYLDSTKAKVLPARILLRELCTDIGNTGAKDSLSAPGHT